MTSVARQECQDEMICGYLDKIKSSSEFLLGLINDMLDISRIESGNLNLKSEQMSREMFGTAINTTIGPLMEQKNITFRCDLQHMEEMIYTDAVRFKQIFFNLLSKAALLAIIILSHSMRETERSINMPFAKDERFL